jgi:transcriptional regulator with XRE-family HTH domain
MERGRRDTREDLVAFGRRLRRLRQEAGLSQEELAHRAGLHRTVIGRVERAERDVGVSTLWPISRALGVPVRDLLPE